MTLLGDEFENGFVIEPRLFGFREPGFPQGQEPLDIFRSDDVIRVERRFESQLRLRG